MKTKQLMLAAFAAALVGVPASATDVYSSNIVGYTRLPVTTGNNQIVGTQFTSIGSDTLDIQNLGLVGVEEGDQIQFFNGTSYDAYSWALETYDELGEEDFGPGWTDDATGERAVKSIQPGEAFWLKSSAVGTITLGGQVPTNGTYVATCGGEFTLVAVPTPVQKGLQTVSFDGIQEGDQIQFFNGTTYDVFSYALETYDELGEEDFGPGWTDDATGERAVKTVDLSNGFWMKAQAETVTISAE